MKSLFPGGWNPPRKLERSEMNTIRRLHAVDDIAWSTPNLAEKFRVSPEAIRRILRSNWRSDDEEDEDEVAAQLEQIAGTDQDQDHMDVRQNRRIKIWRDAESDEAQSGLRREPFTTQDVHAREDNGPEKSPVPRRRHIPLNSAFGEAAAGRTAKWHVQPN